MFNNEPYVMSTIQQKVDSLTDLVQRTHVLIQGAYANREQSIVLVGRMSLILQQIKLVFRKIAYGKDLNKLKLLKRLRTLFYECHNFIASFSKEKCFLKIFRGNNFFDMFSMYEQELKNLVAELVIIPDMDLMYPVEEILDAAKNDAEYIKSIFPKILVFQNQALESALFQMNARTSMTAERYYQQGYAAYHARNDKLAIACYQLAISLGHTKAKTNLATFYREGLGGLAVDLEECFQLLLQAANEGHARAMYDLGQCYDNGYGIIRDNDQAKYWYEVAYSNGDPRALSALQALEINIL